MQNFSNSTQVQADYRALKGEVLLEVISVDHQTIAEKQHLGINYLNALSCSFSLSMKFAP